MSGASTPAAHKERTAQLFRRRTTLVAAFILVGLLVVLVAILTPGEYGHGAFPLFAAAAAALPLVAFALIAGAWPHVIVEDTRITVHNSFFWYDVPYPVIDEVRQTRLGLIIRTDNGKTIPMTAYSSGSGAKTLGHAEAATIVKHAVDNAMEFVKPDAESRVARHVETRNVVAAVASIVIAVVVVYAAVHTYH